MAFRFIHTGDLHLDSPLKTLRASSDARALRAADASRRAFVDLVDTAIERKVDAFLIAGDLWDGDWSDMDAGLLVAREAKRLAGHGIRAVAILGNHDAGAASVTRHIRHLDALDVLSDTAAESLDIGPAVLHGQSFDAPAVTRNLVADYPPPAAGRINVGLLHTGLDGSRDHSPYAPCSLAELRNRGYDYFALAHIHAREILARGPASAGGTVAYCGVLQGRHVREGGAKGAYLVTIPAPGAPADVRVLDFPFVAWHTVSVDLSARGLGEALVDALAREALTLAPGCEVAAVRVVLSGRTDAHFALASEGRALRERVELAVASADPRFLLEEVRVATEPLEGAAPLAPLPHNFDADLLAVAQEADAADAAAAKVREILGQLPAGPRQALLDDDADLRAFVETGNAGPLLRAAAGALAARLVAPKE